MLETTEKPRLRLLLDHFALIEDDRELWRLAHPLPEVLLLIVCGTIAAGDDFDDIADWGEDNRMRRLRPIEFWLQRSGVALADGHVEKPPQIG